MVDPQTDSNASIKSETAKRAELRHAAGTYKRLLIFCDGTGQQTDAPVASQSPQNSEDDVKTSDHKEWVPASNVTRLYRIVAYADTVNEKEIQQITFYQNGVATGALTSLGETWSSVFGVGLNENVCEAYVWLCMNWMPGDEIFIFGFSRGAFTARALSGLIQAMGIIDRSNLGAFQSIYNDYTKRGVKDYINKKLQPGWGVPGKEIKIKVVGVWDTVKSLGFPKSERARSIKSIITSALDWDNETDPHDAETCTNVENAFHALALDEKRTAFSPTLWSTADPKKTNLQQCWFPGAHSDVGGSYKDAQPFDSSDLSLLWMIRQCTPLLAFNDSRLWEELRVKGGRPWWGAQPLHDSYTIEFRLNGQVIRRPGQYFETQNVVVEPNTGGPQRESVHPSVRLRLLRARMLAEHRKNRNPVVETETMGLLKEKADKGSPSMVRSDSDNLSDNYDCKAMEGFRLELVNPAKPKEGYKWVKGKDVELMEDRLEEKERKMLPPHVIALLDDSSQAGLEFTPQKGLFAQVRGYLPF